MSVIEFRTLGTLGLRHDDGRELHSLLAQPKRIALLAYLCIARPLGYHRRDTLLGLFWPDSDQEHARSSLRKSLHVLRHSMPDVILTRGDDDVAVYIDRISCDVWTFEDFLSIGRFEEAMKWYGGDLLTGFFLDDTPEFDQWLSGERARLRLSAARGALGMSNQLERDGDFSTAVTWARRATELADTDEVAVRKLLALQCKAGDRAGAIQTYDAFARRLAADYETEPSIETRSAIGQIRRGDGATGQQSGHTQPSPSDTVNTFAGQPQRSPWPSNPLPVLAVVAVVLLVGVAGWRVLAASRHTPEVVRYALAIDSSEALTDATPWSGRIALSPDGSRLVYIGGRRNQLMIRLRKELHATALAGTEGAATPFFSPDGRSVGFLRERSVQTVPLGGGPLVTIPSPLTGVAGASWGADGFIYADGFLESPLARIKPQLGAVAERFTTLDTASGEIDHLWPDVLPNGKGVLFSVILTDRTPGSSRSSFAVAIADTRTGHHRLILSDAVYPRYVAPDRLLYLTSKGTLMVVPFDQSTMQLTGNAGSLIEGIRIGRFGAADLAVSSRGTLVYSIGNEKNEHEVVWRTRDGKSDPVDPNWHGHFVTPSISPDGKRLAISSIVDGRSADIWVKRLETGPASQLTYEGVFNLGATWTPDGTAVTYSANEPGTNFRIMTRRADGSGERLFQFQERRGLFGPRWSHDGRWLIFQTGVYEDGNGDILGLRPGLDSIPTSFLASAFEESNAALSPNGKWLAYNSNESGDFQIYVVPFPKTNTAKWVVTTAGAVDPSWSHRGDELFFRNRDGDVYTVSVSNSPALSFGKPRRLFAAPWAEYDNTRGLSTYSTTPDDQRFLMVRRLHPVVRDTLIVVENWFEELKGAQH